MPKHDNQHVIPDGKQEITILHNQTSTIKGSIGLLPVEILEIIGEYLNDNDRIRFYSVNKYYRQLLATRPRFWGLPANENNHTTQSYIHLLIFTAVPSKFGKRHQDLKSIVEKSRQQTTTEDVKVYSESLNTLEHLFRFSKTYHESAQKISILDTRRWETSLALQEILDQSSKFNPKRFASIKINSRNGKLINLDESIELLDSAKKRLVKTMSTDPDIQDLLCPCNNCPGNFLISSLFSIVLLAGSVSSIIMVTVSNNDGGAPKFTPNLYNSTLTDSTSFFPVSCNHSTSINDCLDTILIFIKNSAIALGFTATLAGALIRGVEHCYKSSLTENYINRYFLPKFEVKSEPYDYDNQLKEIKVTQKSTTTHYLLKHRNKLFVLTGLLFIASLEGYLTLLDSPSTLENCVLPSPDNAIIFDSKCLDEFTKNHTAGTGTLAASTGLLLAYSLYEVAKTACNTIYNIKDITKNTVNYCWSSLKTVKKFFCDPAPNPQQPTETTPLTLEAAGMPSSRPLHTIN